MLQIILWRKIMSDHQTSYTVNAMIGTLYLKNKAFQSLSFEGQQSIVMDIIKESYNSDVNIGEILGNECFSSDETKTIGTIFKICSYCGEAKDFVEDYGSKYIQGFCLDCVKEVFSKDEIEQERVK